MKSRKLGRLESFPLNVKTKQNYKSCKIFPTDIGLDVVFQVHNGSAAIVFLNEVFKYYVIIIL